MQKRKNNIILGMRIGTTVLIVLALAMTTYFNRSWTAEAGESEVEAKADYLKHAAKVFSYVFLVVTILLAFSISTLLYMLHVKWSVNQYSHFNNTFAREIKTIAIILVTFCASYIVRVFMDFFYVQSRDTEPCSDQMIVNDKLQVPIHFGDMIYIYGVPVVYDLIPIGGLLLFHRRNFS